ncbi:hypothetical protein A2U01_0050845, partial [Trifolium medium]|nr:hypothetical protein [Trifolium medium]
MNCVVAVDRIFAWISSMPFTWWWNWVWNGNPSHLKDQGRVPRQDDA